MRRTALAFSVVAAVLLTSACGPPHITLPSGAAKPAPDYETAFATALIRCHDVRTLTAELALSGRIAGQKIRGRALAGFAPGALRLEALAPGGSPAFILVSEMSRGTLLLARERRVVESAAPAEILDALVGVKLGPNDLRAMLSGCVKSSMNATGAKAYGTEWLVVDLAGGDRAYLRRGRDGTWRFVAATYAGLEVQYGELKEQIPERVLIRSPRGLDLSMTLNQVEVNGNLQPAALTALVIPTGTSPMTLDELRRTGPFAH